jgi:hypothetical protein
MSKWTLYISALFQIPSTPPTPIFLTNVQGGQITVRDMKDNPEITTVYGRGMTAEIWYPSAILTTHVVADGVIHIMESFME